MFESWDIIGPYPSWWLFNSLLLVLQVLHIIWSYLIARIAIKAMLRGKVCASACLSSVWQLTQALRGAAAGTGLGRTGSALSGTRLHVICAPITGQLIAVLFS